ncbi:Fungalysin metallopeptidase-domain-containing protein [Pterulicium gracile]|uniref:Extracellular metalloproteinase n=1 Tax=Pterulicium gracile TaxID=1884261 RepID=A0A5C3QGD2_9AGAR|nr:Fungalysin metallopeptidase-domain-containing protein [Pterula gracilis]
MAEYVHHRPAIWMTQQAAAEVKDFVTGVYVLGNPAGVREFPYSTSSTVNPLRYSDVQTRVAPHSIGQVWPNMLHNVYATLVGTNGWSPNACTDPTGTEDNVVFLHLFLDALALQPCNPSFVSARDAWIQADRNRTLVITCVRSGVGLLLVDWVWGLWTTSIVQIFPPHADQWQFLSSFIMCFHFTVCWYTRSRDDNQCHHRHLSLT